MIASWLDLMNEAGREVVKSRGADGKSVIRHTVDPCKSEACSELQWHGVKFRRSNAPERQVS